MTSMLRWVSTFPPPARAHPVQLAVDVELQEVGRRVARTPPRLRLGAGKPSRRKIQPIHKGIDEPDRVVDADVIVDRLRNKNICERS